MPTLIIEDGSGIVGANAYDSRANVKQYHKDHTNDDDWAGAGGGVQDKHIVLGTQYLDTHYHLRWKGSKTNDTDFQTRDWPRIGVRDGSDHVVDSDEMPQKLKDAMAEAALRSLKAELASTTLQADEASPGAVQRKKVKAGPVEQDITYVGGGQQAQPTYTLVDGLLRGLLTPRGSVRRG